MSDYDFLFYFLPVLLTQIFGMGNSQPSPPPIIYQIQQGRTEEEVQEIVRRLGEDRIQAMKDAAEKAVAAVKDQNQKDYESDQPKLAALLNCGLKTMGSKTDTKTILAVGVAGAGKSTALNLLFGTTFRQGEDINACTMQLCPDTDPEAHVGFQVIDSVGFNLNVKNLARLLVMLFIEKIHLDWLLLVSGGRFVEIFMMLPYIQAGLLHFLALGFDGKTYHAVRSPNDDGTPGSNEVQSQNKALARAVVYNQLKSVTNALQIASSVIPLGDIDAGSSSPTAPRLKRPDAAQLHSSTIDSVVAAFFSDGSFKELSWKDHLDTLGDPKKNAVELLRSLMIVHIPELLKLGNIDAEGQFIPNRADKWQLQFLQTD